ncbi:MAG: VWA domain-containing protein [Planctomycetes bacterium]|nr:VWA domain-containing protein [Planctomycetota bacterium]
MPYAAEISRTNPSCFLFLLDQSGSMSDTFSGGSKKKADGVADAINKLLQTLVLRCSKSEGVRDYYHVGVIGYGKKVGPALGGNLAGFGLVPIKVIADNPLRIEQRTRHSDDGAGGILTQTVKFPVWFEPVAHGQTPMCEAFDQAWHLVSAFIVQFPGCYPPMIVNITDGEASDGDPTPRAGMVRDLASTDGNVLLFNVHISASASQPILYPDREASLPDEFARFLFRISSPLPPAMLQAARRDGQAVSDASRGFVFNADLVSLIKFLDIGTRVSDKNLR